MKKHATKELLEVAFSMWSTLRLHTGDRNRTAVRMVRRQVMSEGAGRQ
jgi:hypothetical protein